MVYESRSVAELDPATLQRWRDKGIVFLIGSYVSVFPPTSLSFGWATSQALWRRILDRSDLDLLGADLDDVPFEAIMQCYPNRAAIRPIIRSLFSASDPNPVHRSLVAALRTDWVCGLITTNYDLALDSALREVGNHPIIFDEPSYDRYQALNAAHSARPKGCFKIHGTAAPGFESTIVCDLDAEGWLNDWKRRLLLDMTQDRTLVLIGYSGSDFDICPELAQSARQAHTVWLQPRPTDVRPNAARVLHKRSGTLVLGDLISFLNVLLDIHIAVSPPSPAPINLDAFDRRLMAGWRLQILTWMACPRLLSRALSGDTGIRLAVYAQTGRYKDAVLALERSLLEADADVRERLHLQIQLASSRFIYGQHIRSWRMLNRIDREIANLSGPSEDLRIYSIETRMMMLMRAAQIARGFRLRSLLARMRKRTAPLYLEARQVLQNKGAWGRLEALQQNAERIGVATSDGLPLPTRRGYRSLGLVSMHVITQRDWLRSGNWKLTDEKQGQAIKCLAKAEEYGWNHEAWKFSWILLCRGSGKKASYLRSFWKYFWRTQYPFLSRFFQLFVNLVPTGSEHKFEDDEYWT